MAERQTRRLIKKIHSDNGGEYLNNTLSSFLKVQGIKHICTNEYTPEQNGVAERINRTLLDEARSMMVQSKATKEMWGEAVMTAVFLRM